MHVWGKVSLRYIQVWTIAKSEKYLRFTEPKLTQESVQCECSVVLLKAGKMGNSSKLPLCLVRELEREKEAHVETLSL